jgi:hypothetical protein
MSRPLAELQVSVTDVEATTRDLRLTRRTGRSFAAAVSVLLIAAVVVNRSEAAITGDGAAASSALTSGTIELTDDDRGRSLFDLRDLTPAHPIERCIGVTYEGTILPVELSVRAAAVGDLAPYLDVVIDEGTGGGFDSCDGFGRTERVFSGDLAELSERGWVQLGELLNEGEGRSYRIELRVQDRNEALGRAASLELEWEVAPS